MELADRKCLDEHGSGLRRDDEQPIRLPLVGGHLRQELVVGHPGRCGQVGDGLDLRADLLGDLGRDLHSLDVLGDVEIRLVERQRLDQGSVLGEDPMDLTRDLAIYIEAVWDKDQVRAFSLRGDRCHRRVDAELPGLVACRGDHAALLGTANGNRFAAQVGIVPLFDRREESIHVDMDYFARGRGFVGSTHAAT